MKLESSKGSLRWSDDQILTWDNNQIGAHKPIYIYDDAKASIDDHAIHKGYVDDIYEELLAKIEELEMAGGGGTNYQLRMRTNSFSSNGSAGSAMDFNSIATAHQISDRDPWQSIPFKSIEAGQKYLFVCFPDNTYSLNSTGILHLAKESESQGNTYSNGTHAVRFVVSEAEKCPDEYSNGKNIWRCTIQPDIYRNVNSTTTYGYYNNGDQIYITFGGGSVTKS